MHRTLAGPVTTVDPLDALLGPAPVGTNPLVDMADALRGRLGVALALVALAVVAWMVRRARQRRRREAWGQRAMITSVASRGFALYRTAGATPGGRVDALTPSWPAATALADLESPLPAPEAAALRPPPWATWVPR